MAICPEHGGYSGSSCTKCTTAAPTSETGNWSSHPSLTHSIGLVPLQTPKIVEPPSTISTEDKLQLKICETNLLKAQGKVNQEISNMRGHQAQLQAFVNALFLKFSLSEKEYVFDVDQMAFVKRDQDQTKG